MKAPRVPGFVPPPYPYDRLDGAMAKANAFEGGVVDLSIGTPCDPPSPAVIAAMSASGSERGYPSSIGSPAYRAAAIRWIGRRFDVALEPGMLAACVGTKEFVATLPQWLKLRDPSRDTVLHPAAAYPTYEMGATLAGCRAVAVPNTESGALDLSAISDEDAERALCLWINSPSNPTGRLDDLEAAAAWGRAHDVLVCSDECYVEYTWDGPRRSILQHGVEGVLAVQSLSKQANLAGVRAGFYAGDPELVYYLGEVRKHGGFMVPGPVQAAAVVAFDDDEQVERQRAIYWRRLEMVAATLSAWSGVDVEMPAGGFYLWIRTPDGDGWSFTERLASEGGGLVSPGELYGAVDVDRVRVAVVQPDERLELLARRLGVGSVVGD